MVPSLFDALESGKELCMTRRPASGINVSNARISAVPEGTMHSFSLVLAGSASQATPLTELMLADGKTLLLEYTNGNVVAAIDGRTIEVPASLNSENSLVALNYTYASGILDLKVYNGSEMLGDMKMLNVKIEPKEFVLNKANINLKEFFLYRSVLSPNDVESLANGELQKGSLEIYSTFENLEDNPIAPQADVFTIENHAMSLNQLTSDVMVGVDDIITKPAYDKVKFYNAEGLRVENPVKGQFYISVSGNKASKVIY